ncbi:lysozyme g-like [Scomber scombrus]|uniref:lysozyme g-like n=1 Tax=Scomber scombrus TaxID=13677 RepID=UPI002DD9249D|nr:lysozyme g-like [Scomber scombrus]
MPGTILANENKIYIIDEFSPLKAGLSWCFLWMLAAFVFVGCVFLVFVVDPLTPKKLRSTLQSWYQALLSIKQRREQEQGLPLVGNNSYTDYGDISRVDTTGASEDTIKANKLPGERLTGVEASHMMAERDLEEMLKYKSIIKEVGETLHIHPALIAGIISRQSQAGTRLDLNGYGLSDPNCFGLMQINRHYHAVKGEPCSKDHVDQGVTFLIQLIKTMLRTKPLWSPEQQLKGALACYIAGEDKVIPLERYEDLDSVTPYRDFSNDVVARAQWFASRQHF